MNKEKQCQIALTLIPGIGDVLIRQLISYCGSAEEVFRKTKGSLSKIPGIGEKTAEAIINQHVLKEAEDELVLAEKKGIRILFFTDKDYPARLKQINEVPSILYFKGNADLNSSKIISIVGTRQATPYGKEMVERIVKDLARHRPLIVSGLAYGIDICAHRCALTNNLPTLGVMASGINIIYPATHKNTALQMIESGGLLTENRFNSKPDAYKFPARNRIIAGLADAVIVVEAAEKGGALITAEIANNYNREVFSVPGGLTQPYSSGCNYLIKSLKANIYTKIEDVEATLNWNNESINVKRPIAINTEGLQEDAIKIIDLLKENQSNGLLIDELSWKAQITIGQLASLLLNLEFSGIVKSLPGKRFKLVES
jgi:DNA processing protein